MGKIRIGRSSSNMMFLFTLLMALTAGTGAAEAASFLNNCTTNCHGMPPRDAARKGNLHFNSQSSAFLGNHRSHLSAAPVANDCSVCHTPVAATAFGHQNDVIEMAVKLKGYSTATGRARYDKGVFFNQTSIPNLTNATCSNASCHFERKTPVWGSAAFNPATDCNACHGAPPSGGATGAAGSHARHSVFYPGTANCQKCHPSHVTFSHATSAGSPLQVQGFLRDPANILAAGGTYSGSGLNYLPSKSASQVFGSCNNLYCHSTGQSATGAGTGTAVSVSWGGAALNCGSCHQNMGPTVNASATGKHAKHAQAAGIACAVCHGAAYTSTTAPVGSTHVDKNINLAWTGVAATPATTYTKGNTFAAGVSAYGTCSTSYCHSTVQNASTGATTSVTYRTVSWASATTLSCAGCHVDMATDATGSGSHRIHTVASGANFDCAVCHINYSRTSTIAASTTHSNGLIELGAAGFTYSQGSGASHPAANGYGTCSATACHGPGTVTWGATFTTGATFPYSASQCDKCHSGTAAAPFYSTAAPAKITANTDAKVGAHTSHLTTPDALAAVLTCNDCHTPVTAMNSATHMNGASNFTWSALATRNGALIPTFNAGTCANVYCHGASMPGGDTSGSNKTPVWNSTTYLPATLTAAACGTCHGFPPPVASGHPAVTIPAGFPATASIGTTCSCHDNVRTTGNSYATIFVNKALHINGIMEVASGGACDTCHGYPPARAGFVGTSGNWLNAKPENYLGGGGAHTVASHVSNTANPSEGFSNCNTCHNAADHVMSPIAFNPSSNIKVRVNPRYRLEAAKQFKYSSNRLNANSHVTGTCSNSSCHFGATPKWDPAH